MEKNALKGILAEIIRKVEESGDYKLEWILKDLLEKISYDDYDGDFTEVSQTICSDLEDLLSIGIEPDSLIALMKPNELVKSIDDFICYKIDVEPIIAKVISEIGNEKFHDEFLEDVKHWHLGFRFSCFKILRKYLTSNEIASLLFDNYDMFDAEDCEFIISQKNIRDDVAEIAIKEGRVSDFLNFAFPDIFNDTEEAFHYCKTLKDRGADEKAILKTILTQMQYFILENGHIDELVQLGFDRDLLIDGVIDVLKDDYYFSEAMGYYGVDELNEFIQSLGQERRDELFAKISAKNLEWLID